MTFFQDLRRRGARVLAPVLAATALLAACGGGTQQVQTFVPSRLLVLGDETSVIVDDGTGDGFKYSLNDRVSTTTNGKGKCLLLPTFSQQIAAHYGFVFAACNPEGKTEFKAVVHARIDAKVDDATTGLKAQLDGITGLGATDLVMVMIGANDVIDLHAQRMAGTQATDALAIAEAKRRGGVAAAQINRVLGSGARALVLTIPEMGKSPYAVSRGANAVALLTALTTAYNTALRLGIDSTDFDGRNYGLVLSDDVVSVMTKFPASYLSSPQNVTASVCDSASMPQGCLIVTGATAPAVNIASNTHLWASDRHLGPVAHAQIGAQALSRVIHNPF
jgi:lysophospholipase L1-like esterase